MHAEDGSTRRQRFSLIHEELDNVVKMSHLLTPTRAKVEALTSSRPQTVNIAPFVHKAMPIVVT